jgi:serine/arginine repetitive matrix protein 2
MYNGIGLLTARGSGTSGYVSTNKFNLRGDPRSSQASRGLDAEGPKQKKANQDILEHNRKRDIEAKVFELHDQLEEDG